MDPAVNLYLDYNATSPLGQKVKDWLKGGLPYGNPSSLHTPGRSSRKLIEETRKFLYQSFDIDPKLYYLIFHSGATEFINNFFMPKEKLTDKQVMLLSPVDHPSVQQCSVRWKKMGGVVEYLPVDNNGGLIERFTDNLYAKLKDKDVWCNFTAVNNETGIVWPWENSKALEKEGYKVHVDATQMLGKTPWEYCKSLDDRLQAYTFSGHKFGALKGVGFSFLHKNAQMEPLIIGGGQENGFRAGTENLIGIYSLKLALEELKSNYDFEKQIKALRFLEKELKIVIGDAGIVVGEKAKKRNGNTLMIVLNNVKADIALAAFDMQGIYISSGSACSAGALKESHVLKGLGYQDNLWRNSIRISVGPTFDMEQARKIIPSLTNVFKKLL